MNLEREEIIMQNNYKIENITPDVYRIEEFGLGTIYFVKGKERSILIDTGTGVADLKSVIDLLTETPYDVLLTHGHYDHAGGIGQFNAVYLNQKDLYMVKNISVEERIEYARSILNTYPELKGQFDIDYIKPWREEPSFNFIKDGDIIELGDKTLKIFETPGHTEGSVCILDEADHVLFSGDNLQPILLLTEDGDDRNEVIINWYRSVERIVPYFSDFDHLCGGHEKIDKSIIYELMECGKGIVEGELKPEPTQIHIFKGMFVNYKNIHITYQTMNDLIG